MNSGFFVAVLLPFVSTESTGIERFRLPWLVVILSIPKIETIDLIVNMNSTAQIAILPTINAQIETEKE